MQTRLPAFGESKREDALLCNTNVHHYSLLQRQFDSSFNSVTKIFFWATVGRKTISLFFSVVVAVTVALIFTATAMAVAVARQSLADGQPRF